MQRSGLHLHRFSSARPAAITTAVRLARLGRRKTVAPSTSRRRFSAWQVADKRFYAHKGLLELHSQYFKGLFSGNFAESSAPEVELPDADPDAFAALLRNFYSRRLCVGRTWVPDPLLRPVVELARRLLVSDAMSELTPRLLAATSPATIAADLLWAEQHNLTELLPGLKAYFLAHAKEAMAAAPDSAARLAQGSPQLAGELLGTLLAERT